MLKYLISLILSIGYMNNCIAQDIWFSPNKSNDVANLNLAKAWGKSREQIAVYSFYYQVILQSSPATLKGRINFLRKHGIKIAIEFPGLTWIPNGQGYKIEGFQREGFSNLIVNKFNLISEKPDLIILDEPFYFGHVKHGKNYPSYTQTILAKKLNDNLKPLYKNFPEVQVGEVEPINKIYNEGKDFQQWPNIFYHATGKKLSFIHADITWGKEWYQPLLFLANIANDNNIKYGIIFNSSDAKASEAKWMNSIRENIDKYLNSDIPKPQNIIFQSWNRNPQITFNDSDPNAFSSVILYYHQKVKK